MDLPLAHFSTGRNEDVQLSLRDDLTCKDVAVRPRLDRAMGALHQDAAFAAGACSSARCVDVNSRGHGSVEDGLTFLHLCCNIAWKEGHPMSHAPNNDMSVI